MSSYYVIHLKRKRLHQLQNKISPLFIIECATMCEFCFAVKYFTFNYFNVHFDDANEIFLLLKTMLNRRNPSRPPPSCLLYIMGLLLLFTLIYQYQSKVKQL